MHREEINGRRSACYAWLASLELHGAPERTIEIVKDHIAGYEAIMGDYDPAPNVHYGRVCYWGAYAAQCYGWRAHAQQRGSGSGPTLDDARDAIHTAERIRQQTAACAREYGVHVL